MSSASDDDPRAEVRRFTVTADADSARVDAFLAQHSDLSRSRVQALVRDGAVRLNGEVVRRKSEPVSSGDEVVVCIPPPEEVDLEAEDLPLDIVYEDADLVVVDKAAGMVVHPAPGHPTGTLVNALLHHVRDLAGVGGRLRPGIVHRLDKDTSGLLVVAKTDAAHQGLGRALRTRSMRRVYVAASWGHLVEEQRTVEGPIGRDPRHRQRMAVVEGGRRARTRIRVRERWTAADLLDVALDTGRTHQIRVHLMHIGHPVVGDAVYGAGRERGFAGASRAWALALARRTPRQFLHAARLSFPHPRTGEQLRFRSRLPADLAEARAWAIGRTPDGTASVEAGPA